LAAFLAETVYIIVYIFITDHSGQVDGSF